MSLKEYRALFSLVCIGLLAFTTLAVFTSMYPYPDTVERFFVLGILGKNKTGEGYYPNGDPNVQHLEKIQWYIFVQNFMRETKFVLIKVKVLNSTMTLPDAVAHKPSPEQSIMDLNLFLTNAQSTVIPFFWHIADYSIRGESLIIERLVINDMTTNLRVVAVNGLNLRLVFEIWHYDPATNEFLFKWDSNFGNRCAWNQMIFNVTRA